MRNVSIMFVFALSACSPVSQQTGLRSPSENGESMPQQTHVTFASDAREPPRDTDLLVTTETTCPVGRSCDIVEVIDVHTNASSADKGFEELRAMARVKQADAVLSAEFEHGGKDKPSHLSAMFVRYGKPVPPHTVLGDIEVPSDGMDRDKGLARLMAKAHAMNGDQVIDVTFEHGEDGAQGVLKGRVIQFDR